MQLELLRRLSIAERVAKMRNHTQSLVRLSRRALAEANPELDQRQLDLLWVEHQYGQELAGRLRNYLENRAAALGVADLLQRAWQEAGGGPT